MSNEKEQDGAFLSIADCVEKAANEVLDNDDYYLSAGVITTAIMDGFLSDHLKELERMIDVAHTALNEVYESGVSNEHTDAIIRRGLGYEL